MQIEIYADVLFFINFIMIYFIFFVVNKLIKNKSSLKRILFSSATSTLLYILTIIFIPFSKTISVIVVNIIILFSIFICFKPKTIKDFFKIFLLVIIVSFGIGGACIALFYYINLDNIISNMLNFKLDNFPIKILLISICLSYIILKLFINWYKKIFIKRQSFYNVTLYKNDENIILNALLDTGNSLKDPITKKPVMIAEFSAIRKILPEKLKTIFYEKQEDNLDKILNVAYDINIRFIPFKSMGKEHGLLLGILLDKIVIECDDNIELKDVVLAISSLSLSGDGFYTALLNPQMLEQ